MKSFSPAQVAKIADSYADSERINLTANDVSCAINFDSIYFYYTFYTATYISSRLFKAVCEKLKNDLIYGGSAEQLSDGDFSVCLYITPFSPKITENMDLLEAEISNYIDSFEKEVKKVIPQIESLAEELRNKKIVLSVDDLPHTRSPYVRNPLPQNDIDLYTSYIEKYGDDSYDPDTDINALYSDLYRITQRLCADKVFDFYTFYCFLIQRCGFSIKNCIDFFTANHNGFLDLIGDNAFSNKFITKRYECPIECLDNPYNRDWRMCTHSIPCIELGEYLQQYAIYNSVDILRFFEDDDDFHSLIYINENAFTQPVEIPEYLKSYIQDHVMIQTNPEYFVK